MKKIIANWKMNSSFDQSDAWFVDFISLYDDNPAPFDKVEAVICPPAILIDNLAANLMDHNIEALEERVAKSNKEITDFSEDELSKMMLDLKSFMLGAQDCHFEDSGAFTGDLSPELIAQTGAQYVIVGHSERRANHHEGDELVAKKILAATKHNLKPILCVGESQETRQQSNHLDFVAKQLKAAIPANAKDLIIAYEPIWAIGTGLVPTKEQIAEMVESIKKIAPQDASILYGGSANVKNAAEILSISGVDGLLVGGASLNAKDFYKICEIASN